MSVLSALLIVSLTLSPVTREISDVEEATATLRKLADKSESSYNMVRTMRGVFRIRETNRYQGKRAENFVQLHGLPDDVKTFEMRTSGQADFRFDSKGDRLWLAMNTTSEFYRESGSRIEVKSEPFSQTAIVTPDRYMHFEPAMRYAAESAQSTRMAFEDSPDKAASQRWGSLIDPKALFGHSRLCHAELRIISDAIQSDAGPVLGENLQIIEESQPGKRVIRVKMTGSGGGLKIVQELIFDSGFDDRLTQWIVRETNGKIHQHLRWRYEERDGVMLPMQVKYEQMSNDGEYAIFERELRLVEVERNQPLADEIFSFRNLGLQEGDLYVDRQSQVKKQFASGALVPVD